MNQETSHKVSKGDPLKITARAWNAVLEGAERARSNETQGDPLRWQDTNVIIWVKNASYTALDRYNIVRLTGVHDSQDYDSPKVGLVNEKIVLKHESFDLQDQSTHYSYAITLEPIPVGGIGRVVVHGLAPIKLATTGVSGDFAQPVKLAGSNVMDPTQVETCKIGPLRIVGIRYYGDYPHSMLALVHLPAESGIHVTTWNRDPFADNPTEEAGFRTFNLSFAQDEGFHQVENTSNAARKAAKISLPYYKPSNSTWDKLPGYFGYGFKTPSQAGGGECTLISATDKDNSTGDSCYIGLKNDAIYLGRSEANGGDPFHSEPDIYVCSGGTANGPPIYDGPYRRKTLEVVTDVTYTTSSGYVTSITVAKATIKFLGMITYAGTPQTFRVGHPPNPNPAPRWVSCEDLMRDTIRLASMLPLDITDVVAIPRSGMLPAATIASLLHLPLWVLTESGPARVGEGMRGRLAGWPARLGSRPVVIDDTIYSGSALTEARKRMADSRAVYAVVYARSEAAYHADVFAETLNDPHLLEWNIANSGVLIGQSLSTFFGGGVALDIDGIILHDAASGGEPGYPYLVPRWLAAPLLITGRAEADQAVTERQLRSLGVRWDRLVLRPAGVADTEEAIAEYKASVFGASACGLMVESSPEQAERIAELTGKPVACPRTRRVYQKERE